MCAGSRVSTRSADADLEASMVTPVTPAHKPEAAKIATRRLCLRRSIDVFKHQPPSVQG
jgi:hypothetical protein